MTQPVRHVLFGPGTLDDSVGDHLLDLFDDATITDQDFEIEIRRGDWGWCVAALAPSSDEKVRTTAARLRTLAGEHGCDHAVVTGRLATRPPRLVVTDVDSTLTTTEAIDLLAEAAGMGGKVAAITERAMRGELDFAASLTERVATLEGLPSTVLDEVFGSVRLSEGARELVQQVHALGALFGVVSGGFTALVDPLVDDLAIDLSAANVLEVVDGRLTGRTRGPVVDRAFKADQLRAWASERDIPLDLTVAVGDGANDLDLLDAAGLGIAYCAKPLTAERADASISFPRLDAVMALVVDPMVHQD
ncbi:phosphoserine phosphatase SerB [Aestuariimicrobium kwangyangense]|uniref:phosphoserine phosphatase SerB n=1 Tax=Aestuariimicrobium kwangyangense TaxID=396389 RepID=UPI001FDFCA1F|nr:phosphoserine phosphatase SerB [Aestuariimicrobium kwangyangense]